MLKVKRILVPTDFSPASDDALTSACQWGRSFGAEVHIFHVLQSLRADLYPAPANLVDPRSVPMTLRKSAEVELETRRRRASRQGVEVKCTAAEGQSAATTILQYAGANDIDLIAMSTHGRRGVPRMLLGSVAEEVVQLSDRPVLTVVGGERPAYTLRPERILVPVDLSDHSKTAVAYAKHLAAAFGAELRLLHVVVEVRRPTVSDAMGFPNFVFTSPAIEKEARSAMENLYAQAEGPSGHVELDIEHGGAVEEILRCASVHNSDLVVLASHGLTGLPHLLMGSVAEHVVRRVNCPVFTVKSFGRSLLASDESRVIHAAASGD